MIRNFLFLRRHMRACRELQRIVDERRNSFAIRDFAKRRASMLNHTRQVT